MILESLETTDFFVSHFFLIFLTLEGFELHAVGRGTVDALAIL